MKAVSNSDRMKIIKHKSNGETEENISKWLFISKSSVTKIWAKFRKTGNIIPEPRLGRKPKVTEKEMQKVIEKQKEVPDMTINELIAEFGLDITESGMSKKLKKSGITFKKRQPIQRIRNVQT
jgi:transposase